MYNQFDSRINLFFLSLKCIQIHIRVIFFLAHNHSSAPLLQFLSRFSMKDFLRNAHCRVSKYIVLKFIHNCYIYL